MSPRTHRIPDASTEKESGTSLIEVMVSAVILALVLLGLGMLVSSGIRDNISQGQMLNVTAANFSSLTGSTSSSAGITEISIPVTVTSSAISESIPATVATASAPSGQGNGYGVYQTE